MPVLWWHSIVSSHLVLWCALWCALWCGTDPWCGSIWYLSVYQEEAVHTPLLVRHGSSRRVTPVWVSSLSFLSSSLVCFGTLYLFFSGSAPGALIRTTRCALVAHLAIMSVNSSRSFKFPLMASVQKTEPRKNSKNAPCPTYTSIPQIFLFLSKESLSFIDISTMLKLVNGSGRYC